jgi:pyrroline-5-carboxylate reductase
MELLITAIIVGFVVYGLERNKARQLTNPHLAGSSDIQDRDQERISTELLGRA